MTQVLVPSRTTPGQFHRVLVGVDGSTTCNCPGATHHGHCWAQRLVKEQSMTNEAESRALIPVKVQPPTSLVPKREDLAAIADLSRSIMGARGQMFPAALDTPGKVYAVMAYGLELGVRPMAALRSIYVVNGRPQPSAELMAGIVQAHETNISFEILELTAEKCKMRINRPSRGVTGEYTYTIEDAKRANLVKPNNPWTTFPKDMLRHACMKRLCRAYAPDLVNGLDPIALSTEGDEPAPDYIESRFVEAGEPALQPDDTGDDEPATEAPENVDPETGEILDGEFTEEPDDTEPEPAADHSAPVGEEAMNAAVTWLDEAAKAAKCTRADVLEALDADIVMVASDLDRYQTNWSGKKPVGATEAKAAPAPDTSGVKSRPMLLAWAKQVHGLSTVQLLERLQFDSTDQLNALAQAEGGWDKAAEFIHRVLAPEAVAS